MVATSSTDEPIDSLSTSQREGLWDTITSAGWIILLTGVGAVLVGVVANYRELFALGVGLILAIVLAGLWMALRPSLEVHRVLTPNRVIEGEPAAAVLSVRNLGSRRTTPLLADESFGRMNVPIVIESLGPRETKVSDYVVPTHRRGRYTVGPLRLAHTDPLRLMRVGRARGAVASLYVLPRSHVVPPLPSGRVRDLEGSRTGRTARGGITFHTLREYVPGDDLRLIHWRSTARTGKLMVRHNVVTFEPRFSVLLDTWAGSYDSPERFEDAVRVAASLVVAGINIGHEILFMTTSGSIGRVDSSGAGESHVWDLLAEAELGDDDPSLAALAKMVDARRVPVSLGVVTGQPRSSDADVVARAGRRFDATSVIQLIPPTELSLPIDGALVIGCETSEEFVDKWKQCCG